MRNYYKKHTVNLSEALVPLHYLLEGKGMPKSLGEP